MTCIVLSILYLRVFGFFQVFVWVCGLWDPLKPPPTCISTNSSTYLHVSMVDHLLPCCVKSTRMSLDLLLCCRYGFFCSTMNIACFIESHSSILTFFLSLLEIIISERQILTATKKGVLKHHTDLTQNTKNIKLSMINR